MIRITCPDCNGSGYEEGVEPCIWCGGEGSVWEEEENVVEEMKC